MNHFAIEKQRLATRRSAVPARQAACPGLMHCRGKVCVRVRVLVCACVCVRDIGDGKQDGSAGICTQFHEESASHQSLLVPPSPCLCVSE